MKYLIIPLLIFLSLPSHAEIGTLDRDGDGKLTHQEIVAVKKEMDDLRRSLSNKTDTQSKNPTVGTWVAVYTLLNSN